MIYSARAEVLEVVDGDTFHSNLDIGWGIVLRPRSLPEPGLGTVRLLYPSGEPFDAAETSTPLGRDARAYARELIRPGMRLPVASFHVDVFGRTLGAVTLPDGRDWATLMAATGYAKQKR